MADKKTIQTYAKQVKAYLKVDTSDTQGASLTGFLAMVRPHGHILDLGCGPGTHAAAMQARGFKVTAYDATPEFVETAAKLGVDAHLATFDDLTASNTFDGIWASFSLLHAAKTDFPRHLGAIHAALKPGGALFLGMKLGAGERRDKIGRFYSYYSENDLQEALAAAGFTAIKATCGEGMGLAGTVEPFILMTAYA